MESLILYQTDEYNVLVNYWINLNNENYEGSMSKWIFLVKDSKVNLTIFFMQIRDKLAKDTSIK